MTLDQFRFATAEFDQLAAGTNAIDRFCSSSVWALSAHETLMPPREGVIYRGEHGWAAFARGVDPNVGPYLQPLEAMWEFASPLVYRDDEAFAAELSAALVRDRDEWSIVLIGGQSRESPFFVTLALTLNRAFRVGQYGRTLRHHARLDGGIAGFLERRSPKFRATLRRAQRDAARRGIEFEYVDHLSDHDEADQLYRRVLDVEGRSWKGREGRGVDRGGMCDFYRAMLYRLWPDDRFRCLFVRVDGRDVAYVHGGLLDDVYRGFQVSFDADFAELSPGNLAQLEMIARLGDEGFRLYDLGSEMEYKRRWAEASFTTVSLLISKR
ncbi:MAG: GNAT family N-acetyltransferase [Myxococcales bacterium]|nr:GNAT family N-acetyltransferase [Myxococcales bacterium]